MLIFIILITPCISVNVDVLHILLKGEAREIYNLTNPQDAILNSIDALNSLKLSIYQKTIIWDVLKGGKQPKDMTPLDLKTIKDLVYIIPENDLANLNVSNWDIVQILGKCINLSHPQVTVVMNSLKLKHRKENLMIAENINKLSGLICGFSKEELTEIPRDEFKKINSSVFYNLYPCSNTQLQTLHENVINAYGPPQTWSEDVIKHIGMIIIALTKQEIRSLRPSALSGLNIEIITNLKPKLLQFFTKEQLENLNAFSKMHINNYITIRSQSNSSKIEEISFLIGILLRTYLLLKF